MQPQGTLGIIVNPHSGRDARRLFARAGTSTIDDKRNQVTRIVVGAAAAGVRKVLLSHDAFRIASSATDALALPVECELLDLPTTGHGIDSQNAALAMREAGCGALLVLGGDGTSRSVAQAWPDAPLVPMSTGTNNVFPLMVEATIAGAAAGLVASGGVDLATVARPAKVVHVEAPDGSPVIALVDMVRLEGDHPGNLMPVEPGMIREVVLARAEAAAVGMSPIGGLFLPCGADDDFGVLVRCVPHEAGGQSLRVPISPGLFRTVHVESVERLPLGEARSVRGPGVLAFDGDREIKLTDGQEVSVQIRRDGPWVIDPGLTLRVAAEKGLLVGKGAWSDARYGGSGFDCC